MTIHKIAYCKVMKGRGPEWIGKEIEVFIDDLDPMTPESFIRDIIINDVIHQLKDLEISDFRIDEIFNA